MTPEMPPDPSTPVAEGAVQMHEMFTSFVAAGFTEEQALRFLAHWLVLMQAQDNE